MSSVDALREGAVEPRSVQSGQVKRSWKGRVVQFVKVDMKNGIRNLKVGERYQAATKTAVRVLFGPQGDLLASTLCAGIVHAMGFAIGIFGVFQLCFAPFPSSLIGIPTIMLGGALNVAASRVDNLARDRFALNNFLLGVCDSKSKV